jgi:hypothetical protein
MFQSMKTNCSRRHRLLIEMKSLSHKLVAMRKPLLLFIGFIAACGTANAGTLLFLSASGQFSSSDAADSLVVPNGIFSLSFAVDSNPAPLAQSVNAVSFDVPVEDFSYKLNNVQVSVVPSEITFFALADGGLFNVAIGSGFTAADFSFQGAQAFSGTTAAPVLAAGRYNITGVTYSDPTNFDSAAAIGTASISPAPEPSTVLLISGGLAALISRKFRKQ